MTAAITEPAWAKVNLYLHVLGKRADGYHLLDSLVCFAGVGDTLDFAPAEGFHLEVGGPTATLLPEGEVNIVEKAARLLAERAGVPCNAAITLTKRLPVAAGIGGGSADAAAALKGLARLWRLDVTADELAAIGLKLGADVPVCLAGRATQMSGVGEGLAPAPALPPAWMLLVNPRVPLSTPPVFKARTGPFSAAQPLIQAPKDAAALAEALKQRTNDLAAPATTLAPVITDVLAAIEATGNCLLARMSGSGATCFGLYPDEPSAKAAEARLTTQNPAWWSAAAKLIG
jgi:4-diphosphocytidyl-2-C-methyl-D-erythritol kinase